MAQGGNAVGQSQPVYLTDSTGLDTGTAGNPQRTASQGSGNLATFQVSVGTTATLIASARAGRNGITITNITGAQQIYVGPTSGVTTTNGALLPAAVGASLTLPYTGAVYGIAVTAAQTVSVVETY